MVGTRDVVKSVETSWVANYPKNGSENTMMAPKCLKIYWETPWALWQIQNNIVYKAENNQAYK